MSDELPAPIEGQALIYATADGTVRVDARAISEHPTNIHSSRELQERATLRKIRRVRREGAREVARAISCYNLDAVISVGYRVNSRLATQFRIWATRTRKSRADAPRGWTFQQTFTDRFIVPMLRAQWP